MDSMAKKIVLIGALGAVLGVIGALSVSQSFAMDNSLRPKRVLKEADLVVSWPENAGGRNPAITFRVPGEYLHRSTTWVEKDGSIKSFAVMFELPGPIPPKERPWLRGKRGTPEYEEFMKTWQGKFSADVGRNSAGGLGTREMMRKRALSSSRYIRDVDYAGLERYSWMVCYEDSYLALHVKAREFLAGKEGDDRSPDNCRLDRRIVSLMSSPKVTADEEGVAIDCLNTGCKAYFEVKGRGVSMGIAHRDIENWSRIVESARHLIGSFVVKSN
jgi:hypothetical protein